MLKFSEAFVYAGVFALHVAVIVDGATYIHKRPFTGIGKNMEIGGKIERLLKSVQARGEINPEHWERLGSSTWIP
jgi:hypothetical protein